MAAVLARLVVAGALWVRDIFCGTAVYHAEVPDELERVSELSTEALYQVLAALAVFKETLLFPFCWKDEVSSGVKKVLDPDGC